MHLTDPLVAYRDRYLRALLASDATAAAACIAAALEQGIGVSSLYLEVLLPALVEIGERWHQGELNVAQEHAATQITLTEMHRLRLRAPSSRRRGRRAVVTAVEEELHEIGARVVADFLGMDGWDIDFLGANTPTSDLLTFVRDRAPNLVVLSVTTPRCLPHAARAIAELQQLANAPRILLGGMAVHLHLDEAQRMGADAIVHDAWEAVEQARILGAPPSEDQSLEQVLVGLGERIRALRRARGWTQQQLAVAAELDRTYVSAVEQGRQNLTLGAMLRLAHALETSLDQVLFPS